MFILRCETVCWLVCGFYEISEKVYHHGIWRAVWGDLGVGERRMDMLEDGCILQGRKSSRRKSRG